MLDIDLKAKLLMGCEISTHDITIKNYKIGEIFKEIGLSKYLYMTNIINKKTTDFIKQEYYEELKDLKLFYIFCMSKEMRDIFCEVMNFFTGYEWNFINAGEINEFIALNENNKRVHINDENYNDILETIKNIYCLSESKKDSHRDDIDSEMREMLLEFEEEENKIRESKGAIITIPSMVESVSVKHSSLNLTNIWSYTIYQLHRTYQRINKIDNENRILMAIYNGNIDGDKMDLEKIHWANDSK